MNKGIKMLWEITREIGYSVLYFIESNLRYVANLVDIGLPYGMYVLGQMMALERGRFAVGGEIFIPIVVCIVVYYMKEIANRCNKGKRIPIPRERFTEVDEDGEVSIDTSRTQELILYVADLEDWLERRGLL